MLKALCNKLHHLKHGQEGFALALTLLIWPLIWLMVAGVYVTGETIRQKIILQNAVDAAASAGAAVQADTLGRIDTLNRALAWTYIQANKMEMDHTVRNWANLNRQTMNNASALLPVLNQNLSLTCVHATPHQSPRASNTVSGVEGYYAGCGDSTNYLRDHIALNGHVTPANDIASIAAVENIGDAFNNIEALNGAVSDLVTNCSSRIKNAANAIFLLNSKDIYAPGEFVIHCEPGNLANEMVLMSAAEENDFLNLAGTDAARTLTTSPGFGTWWNQLYNNGFRRTYQAISGGLNSTIKLGVRGWQADGNGNCVNYTAGTGTICVSGDGRAVFTEWNGTIPQDSVAPVLPETTPCIYNTTVHARPMRLAAENVSAVVYSAQCKLTNPLAAVFGDLTGSWYDAYTVQDSVLWCAATVKSYKNANGFWNIKMSAMNVDKLNEIKNSGGVL